LKASIVSATNAHRLGGNEAPPAIISSFLGKQLTELLDHIELSDKDDLFTIKGKQGMEIDIPQIPDLIIDNTDRNRTSPFAFTGNRFEFRAPGSSSNCASAMIARFRPSLIINTGVAGCIDPELTIGEILVSSGAVQHDFDTSPIDGTPRGWNEPLKTVVVEASADAAKILLNAASLEGIRAKSGVIATGDCFIADKEKKAELASVFGASACEMEGGAIAAVSAYNNIPFVVLRAISDGADNGAVLDFPSFCRLAADNSIKVLTNALPRLGELYC
jgi:5'-methylthioadenosine/S-adenosylhomocysteine nucleosidase